MNILFYTSKASYTAKKVGGAERSLRLLAEMLASSGHAVTYVTNSDSRVFGTSTESVEGVTVLYISTFRNALGGRLPLWLSAKLDFVFRRLCQIERHLDLSLVDIVNIFYQIRPAEYFLRLRSSYRFSLVLRMAGLDWYEEAKKSRKRAERYRSVFASVDSINYPSSGLKELCEKRAQALRMPLIVRDSFVLDIGVPRRAVEFTWRGSGRPEKCVAVCATRFSSYQKRHDLLIQAVGILKDRATITPQNFELLLVGEGAERERLHALISALGLEPMCSIVPYMLQDTLWQTLGRSDLLCHPCDYEGLSKIVAESMIMGLPVLVSNVIPLTDEICDGRNGFLAENTPEAWAAKLKLLIENPDLRNSVSEPARKFARNKYDPEANADRYAENFLRIRKRSVGRSDASEIGYKKVAH